MLNEAHAEWIEARGLDVELAARYGIRSLGPRIAVPYVLGNEQLYVKAVDPKEKSNTRCVPSGVDQLHLWNEDCLSGEVPPEATLIITEGEWDAMACLMAGQQYVVSLPSGASAVDRSLCREKAGKLVLRPEIEKFRKVIVMTDGDKAGIEARDRIVDLIGAAYCYVPEYPVPAKDANDVVREFDLDTLIDVIDNAQPAESDGFHSFLDSLRVAVPKAYRFGAGHFLDRHPDAPRFNPNDTDEDGNIRRPMPLMALGRPEFLVIGGQAGHGKSTVAQNLLYDFLWANPGMSASIFHGEGHPFIPAKRAVNFWVQKNGLASNDKLTREQEEARNRWIETKLSYIKPPPYTPPTFEWLLWAMERHALHRKRQILMIDPWNEIIHKRDMRGTMTDHVGECIVRMKDLADRLKLILIVVHHVTKPRDPGYPPTRYDLADSAHWANKADHVVLAWKPSMKDNVTRIEVAKSKDHQLLGLPGHAWVRLEGTHVVEGQKIERFDMVETTAPDGYQ